MRRLLAVLLFVGAVWAAGSLPPYNSGIKKDTIYVDGTATVLSDIYWSDNGTGLGLMIEAYDDSTAGFDSDSASVGMALKNVNEVAVGRVFLQTSADTLPDSLDILDMDTAGVYVQDKTIRLGANVADTSYKFNEGLDSVTVAEYGAFLYHDIDGSESVTQGYVVELTGNARNLTAGTGSRWILHWVQLNGQSVTEN